MNIGIDLDGCLTDNDDVWRRYYAQELCGKHHDKKILEREDDWSRYPKVCEECWKNCLYNPNVLTQHVPRPGALACIASLSLSFPLYIITSRPEESSSWTWRWLHYFKFTQYVRDVVFSQDKAASCKSLYISIHVDDAPHVIDSLREGFTMPIVYDMPYNQAIDWTTRATDWGDVLAVVYGAHGKLAIQQDERARWGEQSVPIGLA